MARAEHHDGQRPEASPDQMPFCRATKHILQEVHQLTTSRRLEPQQSQSPTYTIHSGEEESGFHIKSHKAPGPDKLRECATQLGDVMTQLSQQLVDSALSPSLYLYQKAHKG